MRIAVLWFAWIVVSGLVTRLVVAIFDWPVSVIAPIVALLVLTLWHGGKIIIPELLYAFGLRKY